LITIFYRLLLSTREKWAPAERDLGSSGNARAVIIKLIVIASQISGLEGINKKKQVSQTIYIQDI
jgi:hypothetical protein